MATQATHTSIQISSGAGLWRASMPSREALWKISIVTLGAVSLAGALALAFGLASGAVAIFAVVASIATGVLGHLAPHPSPSEVLGSTRGEAF